MKRIFPEANNAFFSPLSDARFLQLFYIFNLFLFAWTDYFYSTPVSSSVYEGLLLSCSYIKSVFPLISTIFEVIEKNIWWGCSEECFCCRHELKLSYFASPQLATCCWCLPQPIVQSSWLCLYSYSLLQHTNCYRKLLSGSLWNKSNLHRRSILLASKISLLCWLFWNLASQLCF